MTLGLAGNNECLQTRHNGDLSVSVFICETDELRRCHVTLAMNLSLLVAQSCLFKTSLSEQRKNYARDSISSVSDVSQYRVEVRNANSCQCEGYLYRGRNTGGEIRTVFQFIRIECILRFFCFYLFVCYF